MGRKFIDLSGQTINGIIVNSLVDEIGSAGKHRKWNCICPICNNVFIVSSQHLRDKKKPISMCDKCNRHKYIDLSGQRFGKLTVLRRDLETNNRRVKYICQCECGSVVSVQSNHLIDGSIISCGCIISSGEELISQYLSFRNIVFEKQKTFSDCKDSRLLRFDFYLPELNVAIEYQGEQHYKSIEFFGGYSRFIDGLKKDNIKRDYCNQNDIKLLVIPYYSDAEKELDLFLSNEEIVYPRGNTTE